MAMQIEVWSDYVCPFCYLQEPVVERIEREFAGQVQVRWRAYELRPEPEPTLDPAGDYLCDIWASAVYPMAAKRAMKLQLPPVQPRSRKAFEATEYARDRGKAVAMRPRDLCRVLRTRARHRRSAGTRGNRGASRHSPE